MSKDKTEIENRKSQILTLIREFSTQKLDEEYFELSVRLLDKLGRKRDVPFLTGKIEIWAAAVIHTLGSINFLWDKSFQPYCTVSEINDFFGTKKTTTGNKSREIQELLNITYFNNEFSTKKVSSSNPLNDMVMVNGFIVRKKIIDEIVSENSVNKIEDSKKQKEVEQKSDKPIENNGGFNLFNS